MEITFINCPGQLNKAGKIEMLCIQRLTSDPPVIVNFATNLSSGM